MGESGRVGQFLTFISKGVMRCIRIITTILYHSLHIFWSQLFLNIHTHSFFKPNQDCILALPIQSRLDFFVFKEKGTRRQKNHQVLKVNYPIKKREKLSQFIIGIFLGLFFLSKMKQLICDLIFFSTTRTLHGQREHLVISYIEMTIKHWTKQGVL